MTCSLKEYTIIVELKYRLQDDGSRKYSTDLEAVSPRTAISTGPASWEDALPP